MEGQQQQMRLRIDAKQLAAHQRSVAKVERLPGLVSRQSLNAFQPILAIAIFEFNGVEFNMYIPLDDLHGPFVDHVKTRPQCGVSPQENRQRLSDVLDLEVSVNPKPNRTIVRDLVRLPLVEEPQAFLCKRQGILCFVRQGADGFVTRTLPL
jgi:hypothetical protein